MAKIGKVKVDRLGKHDHFDDRKSPYELTLYYDGTNYYFYFDIDELKKFFPNLVASQSDFSSCDTRDKAIQLVQLLITDNLPHKKMLAISLSMGLRGMNGYQDKRVKGKAINDRPLMLATSIERDDFGDDEYTTHQLGMRLSRYLCYEISDKREEDILIPVGGDWTVFTHRKNYFTRSQKERILLTEWTEEREKTLIDFCSKLDQLATNLLLYLAKGLANNDGDFGKFIDATSQPALAIFTETEKKD